MITDHDEVYATLTFNWNSGEGNVFINADLFMKDQVTRIDMLQDWIASLSTILELMQTKAITQKKEKDND